jgi:hypothetical protein
MRLVWKLFLPVEGVSSSLYQAVEGGSRVRREASSLQAAELMEEAFSQAYMIRELRLALTSCMVRMWYYWSVGNETEVAIFLGGAQHYLELLHEHNFQKEHHE